MSTIVLWNITPFQSSVIIRSRKYYLDELPRSVQGMEFLPWYFKGITHSLRQIECLNNKQKQKMKWLVFVVFKVYTTAEQDPFFKTNIFIKNVRTIKKKIAKKSKLVRIYLSTSRWETQLHQKREIRQKMVRNISFIDAY